MDKNKLTIPIYLNTKIVFDMLATIEDGFSEVRNIQTSKSRSAEDEVEANIGTSNLFAFLSVGIKGNMKSGSNDGQTVIEEKTHTTVSLFQRLKAQLEDEDLINRDIEKLEIGDFVELQGVLKTNPLIDMLSGLKELMTLANLFSDKPKSNQSKKEKLMSDNRFNAQIEGLINGLQADGKKDIICETSGTKVILPTDENYFLNNNMSEVTDGNYKILGKVVQICKEEGEISLLRNTVFSRLQLDKMKEFQDVFNDPSLSQFVGEGGITTTVQAPVVMIIPIAIYI
ncbi:MAG: hypothetical protein IJ419_16210 [Agathobacter sp.]|nr:hypothetical protein [Agathobacter sp.]